MPTRTSNLTHLILVTIASICLLGCGGGSRTPDPAPDPDPEPNQAEDLSVTLTSERASFEIDLEPSEILISATFSAPVQVISTDDLIAENAIVNSLAPIGDVQINFVIEPDGSGEDITLQITQGLVEGVNGQTNTSSNSIEILAIDTIGPSAELDYDIISYNPDGSIQQIEIIASVSNSNVPLAENDFSLNNAQITSFTQTGAFSVRLVVQTERSNAFTVVVINEGAISDISGNTNLSSNEINLFIESIPPFDAPDINILNAFKSFQVSWDPIENASYYQIFHIAPDGVTEQIGEDIASDMPLTGSQLSPSLLNEVGAKLRIQACNETGCNSSEAELTTYLWGSSGYIKPPQATSEKYFGDDIAISGDGKVLAVGATGDGLETNDPLGGQDASLISSGSVYVYQKEDNLWQFDSLIQAPERDFRDFFGGSISLNYDGSIIAIGATREDGQPDNPQLNSAEDTGSVYIYRRDTLGWNFSAYLKASNFNDVYLFGSRVSLDDAGDTLAVVGGGQINSSTSSRDFVYIFEDLGTSWNETQRIDSGFGFSLGGSVDAMISGAGNTLIIGMPISNGSENSGSAVIYEKVGTSWQNVANLTGDVTDDTAWFGHSVAISQDGEVVSIGASRESRSNIGVTSSGATYIFNRDNLGEYQRQAKLTPSNPVDFLDFGERIRLNDAGNLLVVASNEFSLLDFGFYQDAGPNNNRPFSASAFHVYEFNTGLWNQKIFIKALGSTHEIDGSGETMAVGYTQDRTILNGINTLGDIDFDDLDEESTIGSVYLF